ncbi:MAG: hypothetical protein ACREP9_08670 [Candidatus Dormibacteraceae bacterium]
MSQRVAISVPHRENLDATYRERAALYAAAYQTTPEDQDDLDWLVKRSREVLYSET